MRSVTMQSNGKVLNPLMLKSVKIRVHSCGATHEWPDADFNVSDGVISVISDLWQTAQFNEWDWWRTDDIEETNNVTTDN